jgi:hypothetical protein
MKLLREAQGVLYELFDIHALDDMAVVIAEAFARYEPMAVIQGVSREVLADFVKLFGPKAINYPRKSERKSRPRSARRTKTGDAKNGNPT